MNTMLDIQGYAIKQWQMNLGNHTSQNDGHQVSKSVVEAPQWLKHNELNQEPASQQGLRCATTHL
jgi:hypothetical protein